MKGCLCKWTSNICNQKLFCRLAVFSSMVQVRKSVLPELKSSNVMLYTIWYHLSNLKNVKNIHWGVFKHSSMVVFHILKLYRANKSRKASQILLFLNPFVPSVPFNLPENIRISLAFWCFHGESEGNLGRNMLNMTVKTQRYS